MKLFLTREQAETLGLQAGQYTEVSEMRVPTAAAEILSHIKWEGGLNVGIDPGGYEVTTSYKIRPDGSHEIIQQTRRKVGDES